MVKILALENIVFKISHSALQMNLLLKEYLSSGDKDEAVRCLLELEVPHFHHELVYEAVVMVLEKASSLLQHMASITVVTPDQIHKVGWWDAESVASVYALKVTVD